MNKEKTFEQAFLELQQELYLNLPTTNEAVAYGKTRYEYLDYIGLLKYAMPIIHKQKWTLSQEPAARILSEGAIEIIVTRLEYVPLRQAKVCETLLPSNDDRNKWGADLTYKKRHVLMSMLGIHPDKDKSETEGNDHVTELASTSQINYIKRLLQNHPDKELKLTQQYGTIEQIPKKEASRIINELK